MDKKMLEETQKELSLAEERLDENPILTATLSFIPGGEIFKNKIYHDLKKYFNNKLDKFITCLLSQESPISLEMITTKYVLESLKMKDVIIRLSSDKKIEYFANLFKNTFFNGDESDRFNYDMYEEGVRKLNDLSLRELDVLFLMYDETKVMSTKDSVGFRVINFRENWNKMLTRCEKELKIESELIKSIVCGLERSGFVDYNIVTYPGNSDKCYYLTKYFIEFYKKIS